ncbi:MAG TPA: phosphatidylserine decarboxylase, partial [Pseudonocardiaceae bacterium]|nr:phosphatidylserine decarboxylase [Pseudonocardiaceae bacterium]
LIPRESEDPAWAGTDGQQEVYDRLCHFYWLIDQEVGSTPPRIVENIPWFSEWLIEYARAWGSFLDTTESFNDTTLHSFIDRSPRYAVEDSMINGKPNEPSGWLTFNQFFARELNPGLRPITSPTNNRVATAPADCTYKATYPIGAESTIPEIVIKKTHSYASVEDLLEGSAYRSSFANGTFAHYFLSPYSYHRFHTPVTGIVRECYPIQELVYLEVNLAGGQFDAPDRAEGGYEFAQARGVVVIDTTDSPFGDIGLVAIVPVGMAQVSSVNLTMTVGSAVLKGDEFGYFLFGGSDIIVLFQERAQAKVDNTGSQYLHYGRPIATCRAS